MIGSGFSPEEIASAEFLRVQGGNVVLREPQSTTRAGGGTSDLKMNDQTWDVYTPERGTTVESILKYMRSKASQVGPKGGVIVNLKKSTLTPAELERSITNQTRKGERPLHSLKHWVAIKK